MKEARTLDNKEERKILPVRLTDKEKRAFQIKCIENGTSMQEVLIKYIYNYTNI